MRERLNVWIRNKAGTKSGGTDFAAAAELGVNVIWAAGLPGKTAPESAGRITCDAIYNILRERGLLK